MSNISRRKFLKGAGVAALAVAAAGVLAGCSGNDVPAVPGVTTRPVTVIFMTSSICYFASGAQLAEQGLSKPGLKA